MVHFMTVLSRLSVWTAGSMVLLTAFLICSDVLARTFLDAPIKGTFELTGYMLAISTAWSFAFTLLQRGNIRVDIVHARLPKRFRALLDIMAALSLSLLAFLLAYHAYGVLEGSIQRGSRVPFSTHIKLWYFQLFWVLGLVFFSVVSCLISLIGIRAVLSGDFDLARQLLGPKSTDEEVGEALQAAHHPTEKTAQ